MRGVVLIAVALGLLVGSACLGTLPKRPASEALYRDLERLVAFSEAQGWRIDRTEVEELQPAALMSICRATLATRDDLRLWLDGRIELLGGPVADAFVRRGRDLDEVEELLQLSRVRLVLDRSVERAQEDCPFWLEPSPDFHGQQILDDRWILTIGGGGQALWVRQNGNDDVNLGGAGRLLVGRSFGRHMTFLTGVEIGGSASLPRNEDGMGRSNLVIAIDAVLPLVYRHRLVSTYFEGEAGYVAHVTENDLDPRHGVHLGASFGAVATRTRWFFAGAAFGVSYERIVEDRVLHLVKVGLRGTVDLAD